MPDWILNLSVSLPIAWQTYEVEISDENGTYDTIDFEIENNESFSMFIDNISLSYGVTVNEEDITYVTKLDHTDELPSSIQHHLLEDPYLHEPKAHVHDASDVNILDEGDYYSSSTVEGALQEIGAGGIGGGGGLTYSEITSNISGEVNCGYITNHAVNRLEVLLPAVSVVGDLIEVVGVGAGGWKITQNVNQQILVAGDSSTIGLLGGIKSSVLEYFGVVKLLCITENLKWKVINADSAGVIDVF